MSMLVSVVIPTFRRNLLLARCLSAVVVQDFDPTAFEIIVVDDAASEETRQLVEGWVERPQVYTLWPGEPAETPGNLNRGRSRSTTTVRTLPGHLVQVAGVPILRYIAMESEHGPAAARNAGWRAAAGEVVAFTDDDTIPAPGWLKAALAAFDVDVVGVSGSVVMPLPLKPTDYERDAAGLERSEFVTANCFYRKQALEMVGGFDTRFRMAWREDTDLHFRMLENGLRLAKAPKAIVVHPVRPAKWGISLKQQKKSMYNALLYKKHPMLYRHYVQKHPNYAYYMILLALLAALAGTITHTGWLAGAGLVTWGFLTLRFCLVRLRGADHSSKHIFEMLVTSIFIPILSIYWRLRGAILFKTFFL